jgi:hypothetical protein
LFYQALTEAGDSSPKSTMLILCIFGFFVAMLELACYIAFFYHIYNHNNTIAVNVVTPAVIRKRNQVTILLKKLL